MSFIIKTGVAKEMLFVMAIFAFLILLVLGASIMPLQDIPQNLVKGGSLSAQQSLFNLRNYNLPASGLLAR